MKQIKVIEGDHLTPTNKRHILELFKQGLACGTINRITYYIEPLPSNKYKVKRIVPDSSIIIGEKFRFFTTIIQPK